MVVKDIAAKVAAEYDLTATGSKEVVEAVFKHISEALNEGEEVRIHGFGIFSTSERKARTGRNPKTGEKIKIGKRTSIKFKPSSTLKEAVN